MADVFISCSNLDEERVEPMAERLASLGYSVWRKPGRKFTTACESELERAKVVLVLWSRQARDSAQLCSEAAYARDSGKLMQVCLDPLAPPRPFDKAPSLDISGERTEWGTLEDALAQRVRGGGEAVAPPIDANWRRTMPAAGAPGRLIATLAIVFAVLLFTLSAAAQGTLSPDLARQIFAVDFAAACICLLASGARFLAAFRSGS